jgi:hypothetical protein
MSYFAFGLVEVNTDAPSAHTSATLTLKRCADAVGLTVAVGSDREPSLLSEMRGAFSEEAAIPFLCLARPEDDTSDGLISPHLLGVEGACSGALAILEWAGCVTRDLRVSRVLVWFTEGFDDSFERHACRVEDAALLLAARIREENDVPSILLSISQDPATQESGRADEAMSVRSKKEA